MSLRPKLPRAEVVRSLAYVPIEDARAFVKDGSYLPILNPDPFVLPCFQALRLECPYVLIVPLWSKEYRGYLFLCYRTGLGGSLVLEDCYHVSKGD